MAAKSTGIDTAQNYVTVTLCTKDREQCVRQCSCRLRVAVQVLAQVHRQCQPCARSRDRHNQRASPTSGLTPHFLLPVCVPRPVCVQLSARVQFPVRVLRLVCVPRSVSHFRSESYFRSASHFRSESHFRSHVISAVGPTSGSSPTSGPSLISDLNPPSRFGFISGLSPTCVPSPTSGLRRNV